MKKLKRKEIGIGVEDILDDAKEMGIDLEDYGFDEDGSSVEDEDKDE